MEQQPLSGRIINLLQERYIQHRLATGTATAYSSSEPVLCPLRERGLIAGIPLAWQAVENIFGEKSFLSLSGELTGKRRKIVTAIGLFTSMTEFLLITTGIKICQISENGDWKPLFNLLNRSQEYRLNRLADMLEKSWKEGL